LLQRVKVSSPSVTIRRLVSMHSRKGGSRLWKPWSVQTKTQAGCACHA